jgi:hypothetical protein
MAQITMKELVRTGGRGRGNSAADERHDNINDKVGEIQ